MRLALAALALAAACAAPDPEPDAECAGPADCQAPEAAPCDACAPIATELCLDGACEARGEDAVDVVVTLLIDRDVDGVQGLVYAVVADAPCSRAEKLGEGVNALSSGQKTLEGGDLHQDVSFGRVPEGTVTVVALATAEPAGEGAVLARGCAASVEARAPTLDIAQIDVK